MAGVACFRFGGGHAKSKPREGYHQYTSAEGASEKWGETRFPCISRNCIGIGNDSERQWRARKSGFWGFLPKKDRKT